MVDGLSGAICRSALEPARLTKTFDYYFERSNVVRRGATAKIRGANPEENSLETRFTREQQLHLFFLSILLLAFSSLPSPEVCFTGGRCGRRLEGRKGHSSPQSFVIWFRFPAPSRNFFPTPSPTVGLPTSKRRCLFRRLTSSYRRRRIYVGNNAPETSLHHDATDFQGITRAKDSCRVLGILS